MSTTVKTGLVRFSYPAVFSPKAVGDKGDLKYSLSIIIPKKDKATIKALEQAIQEAYEAGKAKLGSNKTVMPASFKNPLKDGDEREDEAEEYKGCMYVTANANNKPGLIDKYKEDITNPDFFYPGCYGRVTLNFYAFAVPGNKGIAAGLNNIQKLKEGDRLDGRKSAANDFDDDYADQFSDDDDDYVAPVTTKRKTVIKDDDDDYDDYDDL